MPIITVFPDVIRAYNRVEVDWADMPEIEWARVLRVDVLTGECVPLRPYVCYMGDYLNVSCDGHAIFWDTEVPLDRSVYYITEGLTEDLEQPCLAASEAFFDLFDRVSVNSLGTSTSGTVWTTSGGAAADYQVNGARGTIRTNGASQTRRGLANVGTGQVMVTGQFFPQAIATGAPYQARLGGRFDSTGNFNGYELELSFDTTPALFLSINKIVAGAASVIAGPIGLPSSYSTTMQINMELSVKGSLIQAKAWDATAAEPGWVAEVVDTSVLDDGNNDFIKIQNDTDAGSTNGAVLHTWDNLHVLADCEPCDPITASTIDTPTTMASNGAFRLKDPVRPCNDLYIPLCFEQVPDPSCLPGSGIFFAQVDTESYDANSLILNPTNARRPIAVNRQRRDKASLLQLVTRTFDDRDRLLQINEPGSPLLLQGPPNYGLPDAYISVGTVSIQRGLSDHRFPVRINNLPFVTVDRPVGPSQGVCGSRVEDTCDIYDTWAELAAAGLTYEDLVRGRASTEGGPPVTDIRTWDDVNAEFADWDAVNTGGRTWADLMAGD